MRSLEVSSKLAPAILLALVSCLSLAAQDAAMQAATFSQQAIAATQQANQQAMQSLQSGADQAMRDSQRAATQNNNIVDGCCHVAKPKASIKAGIYAVPVTVKLKDGTRGTHIYYTLDGWSPTTSSTLYDGPITISSTATLQAIAIDARNDRSLTFSAAYTIGGASAGSGPAPLNTDFPANEGGAQILMPGTQLPLVFSKAVTSHGLEVGDLLPVVLAQDVKAGGKMLAPKGSTVVAKVTQVDNSGILGLPGALTFSVRSITLADGTILPLVGQESKEGTQRLKRAMLASAVVPAGFLVRGGEAQIPAGATLIAQVGTLKTGQQVASAPDGRGSTLADR